MGKGRGGNGKGATSVKLYHDFRGRGALKWWNPVLLPRAIRGNRHIVIVMGVVILSMLDSS